MDKFIRTYYYVQIKKKDKDHEILCHSYNKEKDEYYHKFMDKNKALSFRDQARLTHPNTTKFQLVKCVEQYEVSDWS